MKLWVSSTGSSSQTTTMMTTRLRRRSKRPCQEVSTATLDANYWRSRGGKNCRLRSTLRNSAILNPNRKHPAGTGRAKRRCSCQSMTTFRTWGDSETRLSPYPYPSNCAHQGSCRGIRPRPWSTKHLRLTSLLLKTGFPQGPGCEECCAKGRSGGKVARLLGERGRRLACAAHMPASVAPIKSGRRAKRRP